MIAESAWPDFKMRTVLDVIASDSFRRMVTSMGGYDVSDSGRIMGIWDGEKWGVGPRR